jgi:hypothetical protein
VRVPKGRPTKETYAYGPDEINKEVNSASQHDRLSYSAIVAFEQVAGLIPIEIPLIIESRVTGGEIGPEIDSVRQALPMQAHAFMPA